MEDEHYPMKHERYQLGKLRLKVVASFHEQLEEDPSFPAARQDLNYKRIKDKDAEGMQEG